MTVYTAGSTTLLPGQPAGSTRITDIDALRGFALLGILIANIPFFGSGFAAHLVADPAHHDVLDASVTFLVTVLVDTKFYLLFSFLFGYSFTLQTGAAERDGARFAPRILRRCLGLFAIGAVHAVLLFHGDILTTYAVLCLILLAVHRITPRAALIVAGVLGGVTVVAIGTAGLVDSGALVDHHRALLDGARTAAAFRSGLPAIVAEHLRLLPDQLAGNVVQGAMALAAFLVGLAAGKSGALTDLRHRAATLRRLQLVGFPVGLAGALVFALGGGTDHLATAAVGFLTAPLLTAAYAATLLRALHTARGDRLAARLAPAGRIALTNYLAQSLACVLLFTGVGLGLVGRLGSAALVLCAVLLFCCQLRFSSWWLTHHRYGPVEWLLRAITNARRPTWYR